MSKIPRDSYEISRELGLKILDLMADELEEEDFYACGIAALAMANNAMLNVMVGMKYDKEGGEDQ